MNLFITIIISALAIVGGLALLDWLAGKASLTSTTVNSRRRSILTVIAAVAGGVLVGGIVWSRHKRTKRTLQLLFELELLLAQLEGLVGVVLAQHDLTSMLPFMEAVVAKIGDYGDRTLGLMPQLEKELELNEFMALYEGTSMIISALVINCGGKRSFYCSRMTPPNIHLRCSCRALSRLKPLLRCVAQERHLSSTAASRRFKPGVF